MTHRPVKFFLAALFLVLTYPAAVLAQVTHWVQIEAHATLRTAEDFAARYDARFGNIAGFRITGGWYALAVGPFATPEDAETARQQLMAAREIRSDAYVTDSGIYGQQFWPAGATGQMPVVTVDSANPAPAIAAAPEPEAQATPEPAVAPTPEPAATETAEAEAETEAEAEAETETASGQAVETATAEAAVSPPEPEIPEETVAEARANEFRLSRDERAQIQTALQWFGFYRQAIDAAFGPGTRSAITNWQAAQGFEPSGFLTTRQRMALLDAYESALARYDFQLLRDDSAGIEITLPAGMVAFDRHESPFAHFREINDSGMRVLLISQEGTQATLFGLYEIMQTLEVIPLDGPRERRGNSFVISGSSDTARAHVVARQQGGEIKGWALLWEPRADADAELVRTTMEQSFRTVAGVLPGNAGASASTVSRRDLLAGLEVRRPERSRSGFFVDAVGTVLTTAEAVAGCERVTIDEAYQATVRLFDEAAGIAVLTPVDPLVPLAFAQFASVDPRLTSDIRVSGFSYQDTLTRPILTFGQLADLQGLDGETALRRLSIEVQPGDSGGPVFDANGAVMGMLLPRMETAGRVLPDDVNFAVSAAEILAALERAGLRGALSRDNSAMSAELLTRVSADLTVLVSCWK